MRYLSFIISMGIFFYRRNVIANLYCASTVDEYYLVCLVQFFTLSILSITMLGYI